MRFRILQNALRASLLFFVVTNSFLLVSSSSSSSILQVQRFDLRPTAALVEESRRRHLRKASILEETPNHWFDPRVMSVYATLHTGNDTEAYQQFVQYRHLSRYERHLRNGKNLHPHWHGNYSHIPSSDLDKNHRRLDVDSLKGGQFNHYQGIPLSQGYGTHYVHLWVGSPIPQRQSVIVDTGSHYTAFPCTGCQDCGQEHHTDPYFDPSQSKTFQSLQCPDECQEQTTCSHTLKRCEFTQSYTEGSSWKAYQAKDVLYAGGPDVLEAANPLDRQYATPFMFGCLQHETGLFITQLADGIMGMSAHETTLPKQLYNQGKLEYNMFAMCFRKELGTSRRGVTAGSMTLGGVSSTLDTSPMVYARNTQPYGWFTVHVQNIHIAKNGGTQFLLDHSASDEFLQSIVQVPIDVAQVNSGKGVIVDSGTTDTYLNANAMPAFIKVWRLVTGLEYSHSPVYLTQAQVRRLPTILIQCQAAAVADPAGKTSTTSTTPLPNAPVVVGQVGRLDWERRSDVLLAIPAEHYMEYSPTLKLYTSRLYFTETRGGVLGANAMLGKNVLFDWQHSRIGFSQSSCEYDLIDPKEERVNYASETYRQGKCVLGKPIITTTCMESLDVSVCEASDRPDNVQLLGTEVWTRVVEAPGTDLGSCQEVATEFSQSQNQQWEESVVECDLKGLCTEHRPCQVPCLEAMKYYKQRNEQMSQKITSTKNECGDSFWSACDFDCEQSRLISAPTKDGICLESSRASRECHVDACGRADPCVVPFLVHAILVLETNNHNEWTLSSLERFQKEFTRVSHLSEFSSVTSRRRLFYEGDVDVLVVRPWHDDNEGQDVTEDSPDMQDTRPPKGIQLILQVSISNPKVHKISTGNQRRHLRQEPRWPQTWRHFLQGVLVQWQHVTKNFGASYDNIERTLASDDPHRHLLQEVGVLWQNLTQPFRTPKQTFTCNPSDLYPLAKDAVEMANGILEHAEFGNRLVENMPSYTKARVISSWTIGTQVYDDNVNYFGAIAMTPYLFIFRILYETSAAFLFLSLLSCLLQSCHAYRRWCGALRRRCCGKPIRYQALGNDFEEDDDNVFPHDTYSSGNKTSRVHSPRDVPTEMELSYIRNCPDSQKKNKTSATKRHISLSPSKASMDSP